jgi:hypothetical protein
MNTRNNAKDTDSGQLSMDFLVGIAIFMLGLIIVISMVSGILAHIQGKTIDYDAVAYRTGVILVEDPGFWECESNCPANPAWMGSKYYNGSEWELLADDPALRQYIKRFGLYNSIEGSLKKPNRDGSWVLSQEKTDKFFDTGIFTDQDYYNNAIFGTYRVNKTVSMFGETPVDWGQIKYGFNIALSTRNEDDSWSTRSVGQVPPDNTGYIKRIVKIKSNENPVFGPEITINGSSHAGSDTILSLHLPLTAVYNDTYGQNYWLDIRNSPFYINLSDPNAPTITNIALTSDGTPPALDYSEIGLFVDGLQKPGAINVIGDVNLPDDVQDRNVWFTFPKTFFSDETYFYPNAKNDIYINVTFNTAGAGGVEEFNYVNVTPIKLVDGVLEVKVW